MKSTTFSISFLLPNAAISLFCCAAVSAAQTYRLTDLGTLGGSFSIDGGINSLGNVRHAGIAK